MKTVTAGILEKTGKILVVRRAPGEKLAGLWEFPGGKVEDGESLESCLHRELREELGLQCRVGDVIAESEYHYAHGAFRLVALRATIIEGDLELTVHDEAKWLAPEELELVELAPADIPIARRLKELYGNV